MNLLWLESAIPASTMAAWVIREGKKCSTHTLSCFLRDFMNLIRYYDEALATLSRLHILPNSTVKLALNSTFKMSFRQAITGR